MLLSWFCCWCFEYKHLYIYIDKHSPSVHRLEGPTSQPASTISEGKWLSLSNISPCWCLFLPLGTPVKIRNEGVRMGEVSKFQGSTMCFVFFFGGGDKLGGWCRSPIDTDDDFIVSVCVWHVCIDILQIITKFTNTRLSCWCITTDVYDSIVFMNQYSEHIWIYFTIIYIIYIFMIP